MGILGGAAGVLLLAIFGALFLFALWMIASYNALIRLRNQVKEAWAQIDVQLKRRHDLIPNLVETVKGYAGHEKGTLESVMQARAAALSAKGAAEAGRAEGALSGALGRLLAVVENYPDLKANANFLSLQEELSSTENKIGFSRQFFNEQVMSFNTKLQSFPDNIIGGLFGFKEEGFFQVEAAAEREAPKVKF